MRYLDKDICSASVYTTRCSTSKSHPCTDVHVERSGIVCTKYMPVECRYIDIHIYIGIIHKERKDATSMDTSITRGHSVDIELPRNVS